MASTFLSAAAGYGRTERSGRCVESSVSIETNVAMDGMVMISCWSDGRWMDMVEWNLVFRRRPFLEEEALYSHKACRYWFPVWYAIVAQFTSYLHVRMERDPSVRGTSPMVKQRSMKLPQIRRRTKASTQGSSQAFVSTDFVPPRCCGNMCWSNLIRPLDSFAL